MNTTRHQNGANANSRPSLQSHVLKRGLILSNESPEVWEQHLAEHIERYKPATGIEYEMVEDIAYCRWRLIRMRSVENALWEIRMAEQKDALANTYVKPSEPVRLAHAYSTGDIIRNAGHHEAHLRRSYNRALRDLQQLRALGLQTQPPEKQFVEK
jgi:hypothetical protein